MAAEGVSRSEAVSSLAGILDEPLSDEQSPLEQEMQRRRRIALENQAANDRLGALMGMPRSDR